MDIHTQPVTAAEVLRKNPQALALLALMCVFKNPWLVIRPEAVLRPGRVLIYCPPIEQFISSVK